MTSLNPIPWDGHVEVIQQQKATSTCLDGIRANAKGDRFGGKSTRCKSSVKPRTARSALLSSAAFHRKPYYADLCIGYDCEVIFKL